MGQGSVSFPPQELEALAIFNGHEAMSAKVANARLQADLGITLQKLAAANEALAKTAAERDAAIAELKAAIEKFKAAPAPFDPLAVAEAVAANLLPAGGPDEEPAQTPAGPQDEVALTGSMGG